MDICVATDEKYAGLVKVLATSIFENNADTSVFIHIFTDDVNKKTKDELQKIAIEYNQKIFIYDIKKEIETIRNTISNDWANRNSYSAYIRLLMSDMLPETIDKFLYLDCDVIVDGSIKNLFCIDIEEYYAAAVRDVLPSFYKNSIGLEKNEYFNSGVMLINAERWRKESIGKRIITHCLENPEELYPDQDAINIELKNKIKILHPKYCVFYPEYSFNPKLQMKGYGDSSFYYNRTELIEAAENPLIIHYVDTLWGRPWVKNCISPFANIWIKYYLKLHEEERFDFGTKKLSRNLKIFRFLYKVLPNSCFAQIYYWRRNKGLRGRIK